MGISLWKQKIIEMLLEENINLNIQDKRGRTSLIWASILGDAEIVKMIAAMVLI